LVKGKNANRCYHLANHKLGVFVSQKQLHDLAIKLYPIFFPGGSVWHNVSLDFTRVLLMDI